MNILQILKQMEDVSQSERLDLFEIAKLQNYAVQSLSEGEMRVLKNAAENATFLHRKIYEAEFGEAPAENTEKTQNTEDLDAVTSKEPETFDAEDTSLDYTDDASAEISSPDSSTEEDDYSLGDSSGEESTDLDTSDEYESDDTDSEHKIETSLKGVGILPLIAQITDLIADGKPSEVELAALKALRKLF